MATTGSYIVKKYVFKPYSKIFPELFQKEKERISPNLKEALAIEHVGSTAVPGLGGKGINVKILWFFTYLGNSI